MKKRRLKKTQKALGYVRVGCLLPPEVFAAFVARAERAHRTITAELIAAVDAHTKGETA